MQTRSQTIAIPKPRLTLTVQGLFDWLVERDRLYRERRKLERTTPALLCDVGIARRDVRRAYRDSR